MGIREEIQATRFKSNYHEALINILYTGHWFLEKINRVLKEFNLTEPQFNILSSLYRHKGNPVTVQELQKRMIQQSSNVSRLVDKLVDHELVTRTTCPENRRKVDIMITPKGVELFKKALAKVNDLHSPISKRIKSEEAKMLSQILDKLRNEKMDDPIQQGEINEH